MFFGVVPEGGFTEAPLIFAGHFSTVAPFGKYDSPTALCNKIATHSGLIAGAELGGIVIRQSQDVFGLVCSVIHTLSL
jgi:hypothetical protein